MVGLTLHENKSRVLDENPIVDFVLFSGAVRIGDLVVFIVLLGEVLKDAARFEKEHLLPVSKGVCDG